MKTKELQELWWNWLGTSERLMRSLHEQTAAVMLRDIERVERLQPELARLIENLQEIDAKALACAEGLVVSLKVKPGFRSLVDALEKEEGQQVRQLSNRVKVAAQTIEELLEKNQALIENELAYVTGSLHMLAKASQDEDGKFGQRSHAAVLIDEKA